MSAVITDAPGHLGRLAVGQLLAAATPPTQIVVTGSDYTGALAAAGLSEAMAATVADADADADLARGQLFTASDDLVKLIGRPATTARDAVQSAAIIEASR